MQLGLPLTCWAAEDAAPRPTPPDTSALTESPACWLGRGAATISLPAQSSADDRRRARGRLSAAARGGRLRVVDHFHSTGRRVPVAFSSFALGASAARVGAAAVFPLIRGQNDEPLPVTHAGRASSSRMLLLGTQRAEGGPPGHRGDPPGLRLPAQTYRRFPDSTDATPLSAATTTRYSRRARLKCCPASRASRVSPQAPGLRPLEESPTFRRGGAR